MIVVAGHQEAAGLAEGHGGDPADDVVVGVNHQLLVSAKVEQPARGVVTSSRKRIPVREKLDFSGKDRTTVANFC